MAQLVNKTIAHKQFKRELALKTVGKVVKKSLWIVGIIAFFAVASMYYFFMSCLGKK